jgi:acyl carrier protein
MSESEVLQRTMQSTREYVLENFMYMRRNKELDDDDSLLRTGVITSLGVMELVDWVETTFGLRVDPSDITEENFDTVRSIARYITTKAALASV